MEDLIDAKVLSLAELLREGKFIVPWHQRYYDWEEKHVRTLLKDLGKAIKAESNCYFLGSIMLVKNRQREFNINDGQQRIVTYSLICACLCKIFRDRGQPDGEKHMLRVLFDIAETDNKKLGDANSLTPRVTPPQNNKVNFNNLIRGKDVGANGKMVAAWKKINDFFSVAEHQSAAWQETAMYFLLNTVKVVRLEIDDSLDSNAIFETLNDRGKSLEQVDLMKNYVFSAFSKNKDSEKRNTVFENFERIYTGIINIRQVPDYVRCAMQMEYGFIKKEQFFEEFKDRFDTPPEKKPKRIFDLMDSLAQEQKMQIFKTFLRKTENEEFVSRLTADARKGKMRKMPGYLADLHDYKITRPILLALFCGYENSTKTKKKEVARFVYECVRLLASFVQRIAHVGNFRPSVYEEKFANLAKDIHDKKCVTVKDFFASIKSFDSTGIISDNRYIELMNANSQKSISKFKYILRKIAKHQQRDMAIDDDHVSIEHILPNAEKHQAKKYWRDRFSPEECERFKNWLGNLTLLNENENSPKDKDNENFLAKKAIYKNSSYKMTKQIADIDEWTPKAIKHRQSKLVKIAAKEIWDFRL